MPSRAQKVGLAGIALLAAAVGALSLVLLPSTDVPGAEDVHPAAQPTRTAPAATAAAPTRAEAPPPAAAAPQEPAPEVRPSAPDLGRIRAISNNRPLRPLDQLAVADPEEVQENLSRAHDERLEVVLDLASELGWSAAQREGVAEELARAHADAAEKAAALASGELTPEEARLAFLEQRDETNEIVEELLGPTDARKLWETLRAATDRPITPLPRPGAAGP